jgi:ankyrin repeat protein
VEKANLDQLLLLACCFRDLEIARLLIGKGADVSAADSEKQTLLHYAALNGYEAVARLLRNRKTTIN